MCRCSNFNSERVRSAFERQTPVQDGQTNTQPHIDFSLLLSADRHLGRYFVQIISPSRRGRGVVDGFDPVCGIERSPGPGPAPPSSASSGSIAAGHSDHFNPAIRAANAAVPRPGLGQLVERYATGAALDEQQRCLATAVYFESMGEPLEGQLAVANVVINRAGSGRYPTSMCGVVKQKAQFSFVRRGQFPRIDPACAGMAQSAVDRPHRGRQCQRRLPADVLWYHADYVAPGWGKRLQRVEKIGAHIFYRA